MSISLILEKREDDIQKPTVTLSVNAVTITPVAPAIFSSNQLRSDVLSSGRITIWSVVQFVDGLDKDE